MIKINSPIVVFEGIDGVGKTTQANNLKNKIIEKGGKAVVLHFPSKGIIGKKITRLLKANEFDNLNARTRALLTASDFFQEMEKYNNYKGIIIFDRYLHSSFASNKEEDGITEEWIKLIHFNAPNPDVVFFLKCSPDQILKRRYIDFGAKDLVRQIKMNKKYNTIFKNNKAFKIDASQKKEIIFEKIWNIFNKEIKL